jgi:phage/plasmid-associated DNA primase
MMESEKKKFIEFFREHKFNCFPIPPEKKVADFRYKASKTTPNQVIREDENYGIIPTQGAGNAVIDIDNKERYREFAEAMIKDGYMVIETGKGWHIPVMGLSGLIQKVELYDYSFQQDKIIEIQGFDHYVVGVGSKIFHDKLKKEITYENKGSLKIWDARTKDGKEKDFHEFVDAICKICSVEGKKKESRSGNKYLRDRFANGEVPLKGSSNDYFFQAAIMCNTDGLSKEEALDKIKVVYHKWTTSDSYSERPWSNIISKVEEVYEKDLKATKGRPKTKDSIVTTEIAQKLVADKKLYSNVDTDEVFEDRGGFLKKINNSLVRELHEQYPIMQQHEYNDILFKLKGYSEPVPPTNKDLYSFKNGKYDKISRQLMETEDLADMGFENYDYIEDAYPTEFLKIVFDNVPEKEHPRIKAGLKAIFINYLDPKISVIYGNSGVGKSTPLTILSEVLGNDYALTVELNQFLEDKFIRAKIMGMRLLVFQDLPKQWKDFTTLKTITGEQRKTERGFMKDTITFDNKLKIWASGNYLATIPEEEKDAMYTRRISLIHNIRTEAYKEDPTLVDRIVENEAEQIVSWILNIPDEDCKYEPKDTVQTEWEEIASPEVGYLNKYWQFSDEESERSVMFLIKDFQEKYQQKISIDQMIKTLKNEGYVVKFNIIKNIEFKPVKSDKKQRKL